MLFLAGGIAFLFSFAIISFHTNNYGVGTERAKAHEAIDAGAVFSVNNTIHSEDIIISENGVQSAEGNDIKAQRVSANYASYENTAMNSGNGTEGVTRNASVAGEVIILHENTAAESGAISKTQTSFLKMQETKKQTAPENPEAVLSKGEIVCSDEETAISGAETAHAEAEKAFSGAEYETAANSEVIHSDMSKTILNAEFAQRASGTVSADTEKISHPETIIVTASEKKPIFKDSYLDLDAVSAVTTEHISFPDIDLRKIRRKIIYPVSMKKQNIEACFNAQIFISEAGVVSVSVPENIPTPFVNAIASAFKIAPVKPAILNGTPVKSTFSIPVQFILQ